MSLRSNSWARALALAAGLLTAACGDRLVAPTAPPARLDAVASTSFTPLPAPVHTDVTVTAVIDGRGGMLEAPSAANKHYGYTLLVPAGTVNRRTTFTLHVLAGEKYELELTAFQGEKDVGGRLRNPVTLMVSVGDSPSGHIPRSVRVYYLPSAGEPQAMPTLPLPTLGYVLATIPHFSRYSVGAF